MEAVLALPEWEFGASQFPVAAYGYNAGHAHPALAQNILDRMGDPMGADILAGIRSAEFSFLL